MQEIDVTTEGVRALGTEQDTKPEETLRLREEYDHIASLSDLKPRVQQLGELYSKLLDIFSTDMNFDLNLPVRENKDDVSRDLLRVAFRYLRRDSPLLRDLEISFARWARKGSPKVILPLDVLQMQAHKLEDWLAPLQRFVASKRLIMDLQEALTCLDDVQDLRTCLCYMYLVHAEVQHERPACPKWVHDQQEICLSMYCTVVLLDDAVSEAGARVAPSTFSKILPETRQYMCGAGATL